MSSETNRFLRAVDILLQAAENEDSEMFDNISDQENHPPSSLDLTSTDSDGVKSSYEEQISSGVQSCSTCSSIGMQVSPLSHSSSAYFGEDEYEEPSSKKPKLDVSEIEIIELSSEDVVDVSSSSPKVITLSSGESITLSSAEVIIISSEESSELKKKRNTRKIDLSKVNPAIVKKLNFDDY